MHGDLAPALVNCDWLASHLGSVVVLDAAFFLPGQGRDAREEYRQAHIPGSLFFDIDAVADHASALPHMLPSPQQFAEAAGSLGISADTHVVVYDDNFFMASARVWWTFRVFGHDRVSVLDGGLARWREEGRPLVADESRTMPAVCPVRFRGELVRNLSQVRAALGDPSTQILDARSAGRFAGTEPEPRAGLRSGHIPGSLSLPHRELVDEASRCLRQAGELEMRLRATGFDFSKSTITTCGTGVTAAILALGMYVVGYRDAAVYDGSWTEWGGRDDTPVSTG